MKPRIVVVGSSNTDLVMQVRHLPAPGETIMGGDLLRSQGGKGANQAVAAARLGADVTFIACVGGDDFGEASLAAYRADGINVEHILRDKQTPSGIALIMVDEHAENIIAVSPGANAKLQPADVARVEKAIEQADCLLVQLEIPLETVQAAVEIAVRHKVPVILNPAPAKALPPSLLEQVDYLTPNETEAALLAGEAATADAIAQALQLKKKYKIKHLILTLGEKGAAIVDDHSQIVGAIAVKAVDTTAAGDAFNGALAVGLARGQALADAVRFANSVAGYSTTRPGAQLSLPTQDELDRFLK